APRTPAWPARRSASRRPSRSGRAWPTWCAGRCRDRRPAAPPAVGRRRRPGAARAAGRRLTTTVRIAVVNSFFPPRVGGSAHLSEALARGYAARGHEVLVLTA